MGTVMFTPQEIEKIFELAFGDNAISKGYTTQEVVEKLSSILHA